MPPEDSDLDIANLDPAEPANWGRLRAYAERQSARAAEAGNLQRENAFLRAGIDLSGRLGQAFAATYEGTLDDVEAIRADANDFDPRILVTNAGERPSGEQGSEDGNQSQQGQDTQRQNLGSSERQTLADGALTTRGDNVDVRNASLERGKELLDQGKTFEVAAGEIVALRSKGISDGTFQPLSATGTRARG